MLYLYLVRHGQTVWNTEKRMQGSQDSPVTEKGLRHARALGERVKDIDFQRMYTSTSKRTEDTAKAIAGTRDIPLVKDALFCEMALGEWEGKKQEEVEKTEPEQLHAYFHQPAAYKPSAGESFTELETRAKEALHMLIRRHASGHILVVSHSVFILMLLNIVKQRELTELWNSSYIHDTSLTVLAVDDNGNITIEKEGDGSHRDMIASL